MVVVRLQRLGTKKVPHHRVVAMERTKPQDSRVLEILGQYNPARNPALFEIDQSRLVFWVSSGAQVSPAVASLIKHYKKISVATLKAA